MKTILPVTFLIILVCSCTFTALQAQESTGSNPKNVSPFAVQRNFDFHAQYLQAKDGGERHLSYNNAVTLKDSVLTCYLPYVAGLDFTSYNFDYNVRPLKKGKYSIAIKPAEDKNAARFVLTVSDNNDFATLQVFSANGSYLTYRGEIKQAE